MVPLRTRPQRQQRRDALPGRAPQHDDASQRRRHASDADRALAQRLLPLPAGERAMTVKRRSLLKGLSLGAIAAMAPMLRNARAFAQSGEIPKRVVFFYTDTGNLPTRAEAND